VSLDPTVYPTVGGNCSSLPLIVQYFDSIEGTFLSRRFAAAGKETPKSQNVTLSGEFIYS